MPICEPPWRRLPAAVGCRHGTSQRAPATEHAYNVLLQPEPEGGYTVTCPFVAGLVTYGETLEEARAMAADAIEGYLESLLLDDEPIPESDVLEPRPLIEPVRVRLGHG